MCKINYSPFDENFSVEGLSLEELNSLYEEIRGTLSSVRYMITVRKNGIEKLGNYRFRDFLPFKVSFNIESLSLEELNKAADIIKNNMSAIKMKIVNY